MRLRNISRAGDVIRSHPMVAGITEDGTFYTRGKDQELACGREARKIRGKWQEIFGNGHMLHLEIGMGKGRFLLDMARLHPEIDYVGVERYSSVLLRALERFDTEEYCRLQNVRFLCMDAGELPEVFAPGEVKKIYLNFSDPWPKARHARRRLTSERFLAYYEKILESGGLLEFKTDNEGLFEFSLEQIRAAKAWQLQQYTYDLHHEEKMRAGNVMTEYEEKFSAMGHPICKLTAKFG